MLLLVKRIEEFDNQVKVEEEYKEKIEGMEKEEVAESSEKKYENWREDGQ